MLTLNLVAIDNANSFIVPTKANLEPTQTQLQKRSSIGVIEEQLESPICPGTDSVEGKQDIKGGQDQDNKLEVDDIDDTDMIIFIACLEKLKVERSGMERYIPCVVMIR